MSPRNRKEAEQAPRRGPFAVLLLSVLGGGLVLLLGLNTASAANELRRHDLATRDEQVAASIVQLRNAVAASAAPQNLAAHAAQYGMVPAANPAFLVVGRSGTVRVLGSAAPATAVPLPPPPASVPAHPVKKKRSTAQRTGRAKTDKKAKAGGPDSPQSTSTSTSAAGHAPSPAASPSPSPSPATPSATPVPTITLPGGTR